MESKICQIVTFVTIVSVQYIVSQTVSDHIEPTKSSIFISTQFELENVTSSEAYNTSSEMQYISYSYDWTSSSYPSTISVSMVSSSAEVTSPEVNNQTLFTTVTDSSTNFYPTDITRTQTHASFSSISPANSSQFGSYSSYSELYPSSVVERTSMSEPVSKTSVSTIYSSTNVISTSVYIDSSSSYQSSSISYSSVTYSSVTHSSATHFSTSTLPPTSTNFVQPSVGMSTGGKVAFGILVVVCVIVIVIIGVYCFRKRRKFGSFNVPYKRWTSYGTPDDEVHLSFNEERL